MKCAICNSKVFQGYCKCENKLLEKGYAAAKLTEEVTHKSCCSQISHLQSQLDEVTRVKERYREALEFIAPSKFFKLKESTDDLSWYEEAAIKALNGGGK